MSWYCRGFSIPDYIIMPLFRLHSHSRTPFQGDRKRQRRSGSSSSRIVGGEARPRRYCWTQLVDAPQLCAARVTCRSVHFRLPKGVGLTRFFNAFIFDCLKLGASHDFFMCSLFDCLKVRTPRLSFCMFTLDYVNPFRTPFKGKKEPFIRDIRPLIRDSDQNDDIYGSINHLQAASVPSSRVVRVG